MRAEALVKACVALHERAQKSLDAEHAIGTAQRRLAAAMRAERKAWLVAERAAIEATPRIEGEREWQFEVRWKKKLTQVMDCVREADKGPDVPAFPVPTGGQS